MDYLQLQKPNVSDDGSELQLDYAIQSYMKLEVYAVKQLILFLEEGLRLMEMRKLEHIARMKQGVTKQC